MGRAYKSRWFPRLRHAHHRFANAGWELAGGERWDVDDFDDVRLHGVELSADRTLRMSLVVNEHDPVRLTFSEVADLQIDGGLDVDEAYPGWALIETTMLIADGKRDDERFVYVGALPDALICFASRPGRRR